MGKTEIILVLAIITAVIFIFIAGIVLFVNQYRNRLRLNEQDKLAAERQHKVDLLHNQLKVQQQTMQFIGSEIHDSVAQKLTLATLYSRKMELDAATQQAGDMQQAVSSLINDALEELKDLSRTLSNYHIRDNELHELIKMECRKINTYGICTAEVTFEYDHPLPFPVKSSVLRVIQEFLQNSIKHAGCTLITIVLQEKEGLSVILRDNGKGFDTNEPHANGAGLGNMKRRASLAGGTCAISSQPGQGTSLELFIDHKYLFP